MMPDEGAVDFSRVESNYIRQVLGEPLHHALCAIILYQPSDPIDFLANYLRYWVKHVRTYRRHKIAEQQIDWLLTVQLPWNVSVIAEKAKRLEQEALDEARRIAEEEARKAALERARIKAASEAAIRQSGDQIRTEAASIVLHDGIDKAIELAVKKFEAAEQARKKAEELARRKAREEEEAMDEQKAEEQEEEEQNEDD
ncbi:hypothetical protein CRM22_010812 [Opisthorchis felineus]|uniref:RIIa domain-containing protein n=1 Tax=Opisthorchis felineus TaxID=147828 RepID=A0A4S2KR13_OPIFE|nr:hypothetical protein CRM22_010812 [Opisthorchis felineus]